MYNVIYKLIYDILWYMFYMLLLWFFNMMFDNYGKCFFILMILLCYLLLNVNKDNLYIIFWERMKEIYKRYNDNN